MAYIAGVKTTLQPTDSAAVSVALPAHQVGDLLLFGVSKDDATGGAFVLSGSGWVFGGQNNNGASGNSSNRVAWGYKLAASASESPPLISSTDVDSWSAVALAIRGVDQATPIDVSNGNGVVDSSLPYVAASVTTTTNNALVLYIAGGDPGMSPSPPPGFMLAGVADSGNDAVSIAWQVQRTAGATPSCDFFSSASNDRLITFTVAIRDGSSGTLVPGYPNRTFGTLVSALKGVNVANRTGAAATGAVTTIPGTLLGESNAPTLVYQVDISPETYVDITAAAANATDADVVPFPATEALNDYVAIGHTSQFRALRVDRLGCTNGVAGVVRWEYLSSSGAWQPLPNLFDATTSFTSTLADQQIVAWGVPSDWTQQSLNSQSLYWVRARITTLYTTNPTISQIFVGTYAILYDGLGSVSDTGTNPLFDSIGATPGSTANIFIGDSWNINTNYDLSSGYVIGTYIFGSPRDYVDISDDRTDIPVPFGFIDTSNNIRMWTIGVQDDSDTVADSRNIYAVQPSQTIPTYQYTSPTPPTISSFRRMLIAANCRYGSAVVNFNQLVHIQGPVIISGGGTGLPLTYDRLVNVLNGYPCPLLSRSTNTCYVPVQLGGSEAVFVDAELFALRFPTQALLGTTYSKFHVDPNTVGIIIDGRAGDTIKLRNATISGGSPWLFTIAGTASASATYDFTGLTLINATVTLQPVFTFAGMTFISCGTFTQNGASVSGCTFTNTKVTSNNPANIVNCSFTSSGTGHAIEITAPGTYTFNNNRFSGYGAAGTANAAIYNNSGGAVTLNVTGTQATTFNVTDGPGASTTVNSNISITLTGLKVPSEVRVFQAGTTTEVPGTGVENSTSSHAFSIGAGVAVDIAILSLGYQNLRILNFSSSADASIPISQVLDRQYSN